MANYPSAVIAQAESWNSYQEKSKMGTRAEREQKHWSPGSSNITIFWDYYKDYTGLNYQYGAWCAGFVSTMFVKAYGLNEAKRLLGGNLYINCQAFISSHSKDKRLTDTPSVGDVVFFWSNSSKKWAHTGIVRGVYKNYIISIEGNTDGEVDRVNPDGGAVCTKKHYFTSTTMKFWHPDYDSESSNKAIISNPYEICSGIDGLKLTAALNVRTAPYDGKVIKTLPKGSSVSPTQKVFVNTKSDSSPWYYIPDLGYISAKYVEGWVYEVDVRRWWYVYKGYSCFYNSLFTVDDYTYYADETGYIAESRWIEFADGWRYFDEDGRMARSQYIKSASGNLYYWINEYGLWETSEDVEDLSKASIKRASGGYFRIEIFDLVNREREKAGVPKLSFRSDITEAANLRAYESSVSWSHNRPNNTQFFTVNNAIYGENLAKGYTTAEQVVTAWMNSKTHKEVMLDPSYKGGSVGVYKNTKNTWYSLELTI